MVEVVFNSDKAMRVFVEHAPSVFVEEVLGHFAVHRHSFLQFNDVAFFEHKDNHAMQRTRDAAVWL
jgi:hypothetical protein